MAESLSPERAETRFLRRLSDLEDVRKPYEDEWQRVTDYVLPRRGGWNQKKPSEDKTNGSKSFDNTATACLQLMSDGLLGHLVPASIPFFRIRASIPQLEKVPGFRSWLDKCELHLLQVLERSNFYASLGELFPDAGALGTAIMYMEEDPDDGRIYFSVRHLKECYIAEDGRGNVDTLYRRFLLTRRNLVEKFPGLSKEQQEKAKKHPDEEVEILHAVEPGEEWAYDSTYILLEEAAIGSGLKDHILEEGHFDRFPYIVWRFRKLSEEVYGRSPAMDGIWDIEMLSFMAKSLAEAAQKALSPPLLTTESMRGKIRVNPSGITYSDRQQVGGQVTTLYGGALGQYPIGQDAYLNKQKQVREMFRADFFSYLLADSGGGAGQRTATEINAVEAQKAAVLGSTIGRTTKEVFEKVIQFIFWIEDQARRLPGLPEEFADAAGQPLEIEYTGPLARKQRQYLRSQGILDGFASVAGIVQASGRADAFDNLNFDFISREAAESNGMPSDALLDPKLVQKIRQARAEQQMAMQQAQLELEKAKVAPGLTKAPEPGSPAEAMQGGRR